MIKIGNADIVNIYIGDSAATAVYLGNDLVWSAGGKDYEKEYFTLSALESGTFTWNVSNVEYSLNDGAWTTWDSANGLSVSADDKVRFKSSSNMGYSGKTITATGNFDVEGNSMSLLYGDDFSDKTSVPNTTGTFCNLFGGNVKIINAKNLILPSLIMKTSGYDKMFSGCTGLVTSPKTLPATTMANWCYRTMFANCTSLTTAPEILVMNASSQQSFNAMFQGCTSLTTAPELPATTIGQGEYVFMFYGCTSLTKAPSILPATTLTGACYQNMFYGCTSLTTAPELPATYLYSQSYDGMFDGCTSLNYVKCLATNITATNCTRSWLNGVAANGTFVKDASMSSWGTGANGIPSGWQVQDA